MSDERDAIRDELAGFHIGTGYYGTQVSVGEAADMADLILASDWLAQHDREVAARALREAADRIDRGPDFPLPPSIFSALLREYAEDAEEGGA